MPINAETFHATGKRRASDLIAGAGISVAIRLAARLLGAGHDVTLVLRPGELTPERVRHTVAKLNGPAALRHLSCVVTDPDIDPAPALGADRMWWLGAPACTHNARQARRDELLLSTLSQFLIGPSPSFQHVLPYTGVPGDHADTIERIAARRCTQIRRIRLPAMFAEEAPTGCEPTGLNGSLDLILRIRSRVRRCGPEGGPRAKPFPVPGMPAVAVPMATPDSAVTQLVRLVEDMSDQPAAAEPGGAAPEILLTPDVVVCGTQLWEAMADAAGAVVEPQEVPASVLSLVEAFMTGADIGPRLDAPPPPDHRPVTIELPDEVRTRIEEATRVLHEAEISRTHEALQAAGSLAPVVLARPDGGRLDVLRTAPVPPPDAAGRPPLVIVNALGQSTDLWFPLVGRLKRHRPMALWPIRAERPDGSGVVSFDEQVADTLAVLDDLGPCHLLGWCTGAKTAFAVQQARPGQVLTVTALNGSFKTRPDPEETDAPYESNLASIAGALARRPELAERLGAMSATATEESEREDDDTDLAQEFLRPGPVVRSLLSAPFADPGSLRSYGAQMVDFWDRPAWDACPDLPVLAIHAELDEVVSVARARAALADLPDLTTVDIPGVGHTALFDDAVLVAAHIEEFLISHDFPSAR